MALVTLLMTVALQAAMIRETCGWPFVCGRLRVGFPIGIAFLISVTLVTTVFAELAALRRWSAVEVRNDPAAIGGIIVVSQFFMAICLQLFTWLGISLRDDAVERKNPAAALALVGALLAIGLIVTGGNIGEGPSYMNNVFSVGLAAAAFFWGWLFLELGGKIAETITEERNLNAGLRVGSFFLAEGLILGRAVAGDWHSTSATMRDFVRDGWPAIPLVFLAIAIERGKWKHWIGPVVLYAGAAVAWLLHIGWWEGFAR